ncbi:MAG: T9SS type A sorting domain-containing protein [Gemmatimonadetes bacterium]|jgi:uncharacterized repeat protein (TIGR03806 family)|nr:T9SS type A sorting domain-containing protein [Gemmatimonadota bacterium]MBT5059931.1 T9SS type A sorting domain-containing protein [Gemmatimonadota bacterium]MBT5145750.1 T9SS type A sorting domain-containing protein [Gemmatimonadota bacterium]MBT5588020.1 T9SS type A sorting domain-containing protein [Gemmatimonadota bacterium]MBT5960814.1 T9SS type A sorting domain-containing protein [Gemmatimonadota bacterium]
MRRFSATRGLFFCLICACGPVWAQGPVGIETRVPNTSLLIDLVNGDAPETISTSGLYVDIDKRIIAPGIIPYGVNSALWSDGASKTRFLALPGLSQVEFSRDGDWAFPANSVLVKNFYLDLVGDDGTARRQIVETRFLVKVGDTFEWKGFSYQWNAEATDAQLLFTSRTESYTTVDATQPDQSRQLEYLFPAPEDCGSCHTFGVGQVLGPRTSQLNGDYDYDGVVAHQLTTLNHLGLFTQDIGSDFSDFPRLVDHLDEAAPIAMRARSYLQANCAHCHLPGGLRRTEIDLRFDTPLDQMGIVDAESGVDDLGGEDRRIVRPGIPDNSVLLLRTLELGEQRMPPVATSIIDPVGTDVLRRWILSLGMPTAITESLSRPQQTQLLGNYPNPFNPQTSIRYTTATQGVVELTIYDINGRRVRVLSALTRPPGEYVSHWDGRDEAGRSVASGVYVVRLRQADVTQSHRLTLLK